MNLLKNYRIDDRQLNQREFFLLVCEGSKTEPNYFNDIKSELPKHIVTIEIEGGCGNTVGLIEVAKISNEKRKKKYGEGFDHIWIIFDKDEFTAQNFNYAVFNSKKENINCAYSNESFELWYLLHFEYCETRLTRHQYVDKLKGILGSYDKSDKLIYEKIINKGGDQAKAINWARRLYNKYDHRNPYDEDPSTTVFMLIEKLNEFKE